MWRGKGEEREQSKEKKAGKEVKENKWVGS